MRELTENEIKSVNGGWPVFTIRYSPHHHHCFQPVLSHATVAMQPSVISGIPTLPL